LNELRINPYDSEEITPPFSAEWDAKRRVAAAIRRLSEVLVTSTPPVEELHRIADTLEHTAESYANYPRLFGRIAFVDAGGHGNFAQLGHELNALEGRSNPVALPLNIVIENGIARGTVKAGWAYEGPPGGIHGGFVAAIFDQFMGVTQQIGGQPGMTGTLSVRYLVRTPIDVELRLKGWVANIERRKTFVKAEMRAGDTLTATCEGVFIRPRDGTWRSRPKTEPAPGKGSGTG